VNHLAALRERPPALEHPVLLYGRPGHEIYWIGSQENTAFHCNAYLVVHGDTVVLLDPGSRTHHFDQVKRRVAEVVDPMKVTHIVGHHQDPDVVGSIPAWLEGNPDITIVTTPRVRVLIPYYGFTTDRWLDVDPNDSTMLDFQDGDGGLVFIVSPFLHFPEAFTTYDLESGFLFTSDIGAAISHDWELVVSDFAKHADRMTLFHVFYMASQAALRGYWNKVAPFRKSALLPQHGSIIAGDDVDRAIKHLCGLACGLDLHYPPSRVKDAIAGIIG